MEVHVHSEFFLVDPALYNLSSLAKIDYITMPLVGDEQLAERRLYSGRGIIVVLAVLALTISLAGRVFGADIYTARTAHSSVVTQKVQHRDADAFSWVPPAASFTLLWTAEPSLVPDTIEQLHVRAFDHSLYNRPPPVR